MTKIVCISTELPLSWIIYEYKLELYKIYEGILKYEGLHKGYSIIGVESIFGEDISTWLPADNFMTIAEWRDKQIDDILDDC